MFNLTVALPLGTIFLMQALMTMAAYGIAVIAPDAAEDMGLSADAVGFLTGTLYLTAMVTGPFTPALMRRLGATKVFQLLVVLVALGAVSLMAAHPLTAFLGAFIIGIATGPMNPSGSHVLAKATPTVWLPFVFSVKQCGTPAGGMLAGAVLPPLALLYDWRVALAVLPISAVFLIGLAPFGKLGIRAQEPAAAGRLGAEVVGSIKAATATSALRHVGLSGACLGGCQLAIASYFVVYLWGSIGMSPTEAGQIFVAFHVVGIIARLILGALAERWIPTRLLLPILGLLMACGTFAAAFFSPQSSLVYIYAVTAVLGISGNGWVGLFFSELARLAPGRAALVAGGGQFLMYIGIVVGPVVFATVLAATGSYQVCLFFFSGVALITVVPPVITFFGRRQSVNPE